MKCRKQLWPLAESAMSLSVHERMPECHNVLPASQKIMKIHERRVEILSLDLCDLNNRWRLLQGSTFKTPLHYLSLVELCLLISIAFLCFCEKFQNTCQQNFPAKTLLSNRFGIVGFWFHWPRSRNFRLLGRFAPLVKRKRPVENKESFVSTSSGLSGNLTISAGCRAPEVLRAEDTKQTMWKQVLKLTKSCNWVTSASIPRGHEGSRLYLAYESTTVCGNPGEIVLGRMGWKQSDTGSLSRILCTYPSVLKTIQKHGHGGVNDAGD